MNAKYRKIAQSIGLFFIFAGIFSGCEVEPFKAGLGPKVDITAPEIHEITPPSGNYLKDNVITFRVRVTDDIAVTMVDIHYRQEKKDNWKVLPMTQEADPDWWSFTLDFTNPMYWIGGKEFYSNGDFYIKITAYDGSGKETISDPTHYFIKTSPPDIEMSVPYLEAKFWETIPVLGDYYDWSGENEVKKPIVFQKGDIFGNVSDIQGILAPYPQIKIWNPGAGETEDTYGWDYLQIDNFIGPPDWATREDLPGAGGARNIGFKLGTFERRADGTASDTPMAQSNAAPYKFRVRAKDIGDSGTGENQMEKYYPPLGYPAAEFFIVLSEGPPVLDLYYNDNFNFYPPHEFLLPADPAYDIHRNTNPSSPYGQDNSLRQKYINGENDFVIEARTRHGSGIKKALLGVSNNSAPAGSPERALKYLHWEQGIGSLYNTSSPNPDPAGDPRWVRNNKNVPEREFLFLSPKIKDGVSIPVVDADNNPTGEEYVFSGAEYEFTVRVWEGIAEEDEYTEKGVLIRIVDNPPEIAFTNINMETSALSSNITTLSDDLGEPVIR
ncbi:MAG: hypothetical protein FWG46_07030, partial [Treponema sp.]|nr:hypothetical protein [Treponema sp.]